MPEYKKYVFHWRSKEMDCEGKGEVFWSKESSKEQEDKANKEWPYIEHRIEEIKQ